jgi:hypothetical protein
MLVFNEVIKNKMAVIFTEIIQPPTTVRTMASKDPMDLQSRWYHQFFSFDVSLCMINHSASKPDHTHVYVWNYKDLQIGLKHLFEFGMCSLEAYNSLDSLLGMLHNGIYLDAHYMMPSLIHSERIMNIIYYLDLLEPSRVVPKETFMGAMIEHRVANGLDADGEKIDAPFEDLIPNLTIDCEQETRAPLSSMCCNIESKQDIPNGRTPKVQEPKRKFLNGKLRNLLTRKMSNRRIPNLTIATTLSSSTEPLSDDDDSIWNAMQSQQTNIAKNLSIKYSRRSEISDGSATAQISAADIMKRALRPNSTHVNVSYWTERNLRPYMEDRVLIDRVGYTLPVFISEISEEISIPALVNGLDEIDELVSTGPIHIDSISFGQNPISLYSVFDGHAGALASQFCSDWFSSYLVKQPLFHTNLPKALESTFKSIDRDFMSTGNRDGTTACVCVVIGGKRVICANAGDSRAIIVKNDGSFVPLSTDHKPGKEKEARRILDLGGKILFNGSWRVEGLVQKNLIDFVLS